MPSTVPEVTLELPDYSDYLHVVVAVIDNGRGEVLIAKRHEHLHQGGLWEFPGGKVEVGEAVYTALARELTEELAIEPGRAHQLIRIPHQYPERKVLLDVWRVTSFRGELHGAEGQSLKWVRKDALGEYEFPEANRSIITAAQLPSCYLITPEPGGEAEWPDYLQQLRQSLNAGITLLQLRATSLNHGEYWRLLRQVSACCQEYGAGPRIDYGAVYQGLCTTRCTTVVCFRRYTHVATGAVHITFCCRGDIIVRRDGDVT